jgi:hypothetical protein
MVRSGTKRNTTGPSAGHYHESPTLHPHNPFPKLTWNNENANDHNNRQDTQKIRFKLGVGEAYDGWAEFRCSVSYLG